MAESKPALKRKQSVDSGNNDNQKPAPKNTVTHIHVHLPADKWGGDIHLHISPMASTNDNPKP
jgi:hypothetical protein